MADRCAIWHEFMRVAFDTGAKRFLLRMTSVTDVASVPCELLAKFQTGCFSDLVDAVFNVPGVESL